METGELILVQLTLSKNAQKTAQIMLQVVTKRQTLIGATMHKVVIKR